MEEQQQDDNVVICRNNNLDIIDVNNYNNFNININNEHKILTKSKSYNENMADKNYDSTKTFNNNNVLKKCRSYESNLY